MIKNALNNEDRGNSHARPLFTYYHCIHANVSYSEEQMQHVLLRAYGGWDRNSIIVVMLVRETRVKL